MIAKQSQLKQKYIYFENVFDIRISHKFIANVSQLNWLISVIWCIWEQI